MTSAQERAWLRALLPTFGHGESFAAAVAGKRPEEILDAAQNHALLGVFGPWLLELPGASPADRQVIERRIAFQRLAQTGQIRSLQEIAAAAAGEGIGLVSLKGPLLSERLYGDPTARASMDLDLLVSRSETPRLVQVLERLGYETDAGPTTRYYWRNQHHLVFHRAQKPLVEVHFRLFSGFGQRLAAEPFLARARKYEGALGIPLRILSPEDELLFLLAHAVGHAFSKLIWLHDLAVFVRQHADLDWRMLADRAAALRLHTAVAYGLARLQQSYGLVIPKSRLSIQQPWRSGLACAIEDRVAGWREMGPQRTVGLLVHQTLLCDHVGASLAFAAHHATRIVRRRAQKTWPQWAPEDWAG